MSSIEDLLKHVVFKKSPLITLALYFHWNVTSGLWEHIITVSASGAKRLLSQ